MIKSILTDLFAPLLPASCMLCGTVCDNTLPAPLLCQGCEDSFPARLDPQHCCPVCAAPVWQSAAGTPVQCLHCRQSPPAFSATAAAFPYQFPVNTLLQQLKYHQQLAVADWLGLHLADQIGQVWPHDTFDAIIPLPLHPVRLRWRGFNQAMQLARVIHRYTRWPLVPQLVTRQLPTVAQASLNRDARLENVREAFYCPESLHGTRLLLVDDVMTTGSTLNACSKALQHAGADTVCVAVVARAASHQDY